MPCAFSLVAFVSLFVFVQAQMPFVSFIGSLQSMSYIFRKTNRCILSQGIDSKGTKEQLPNQVLMIFSLWVFSFDKRTPPRCLRTHDLGHLLRFIRRNLEATSKIEFLRDPSFLPRFSSFFCRKMCRCGCVWMKFSESQFEI